MDTEKRTRRSFLKTMGLGALAAAAPGQLLPAAAKKKKPNVILVMTDDQGYGDLGCHGNKVIQTPHLDKLHGQSVRLTNFHVDPTCSPTRAALMTGRYRARTGVWHTIMGRSLLRRDEVTMADVLGAGGYATGMFGKWHLGDNYPFRPQDRGFQEALAHGGGGVGQTPDYFGNKYFDDTYWHNGVTKKYKGYCTDIWFNEAMRFIEANKDRPFFAYIPTNAAHGPFLVAEKYKALYAGKPGVPSAAFWGMVTNIDENMARLDKRLEALGLKDNTILIFMTDNGTAGGFRGGRSRPKKPRGKAAAKAPAAAGAMNGFNAGMRGTKGSEYEGGHRVPCFIRWPAGELADAGTDIANLTCHFDLLPTLAQLCGVKPPQKPALDGKSLVPLLTGKGEQWPQRTLIVDSQRIEHPQKWRKSAVMTDKWRLVNGNELYDIPADPGQTADVAAKNPKVVQTLREAYERWWADVSTRFDEYCEIVLGSDKENPSRLTCHDWHSGKGGTPWNQGAIRGAAAATGFWAVEIEREATYEFALRRWPEEVNQPITAAGPGRAIQAVKARLKIADFDRTVDLEKNAVAVTFQAKLKPCKTKLEAWFIDEGGKARGVFYVYVKRL